MPDLLLDDCINWHSKRYPDKTAISFKQERISYSEFNGRINRLAHGLASNGIGRGDNVALLSMNNNKVLEICFALARTGAPYVPISYMLSAKEILEYGQRMRCKAWIVDQPYEELLLGIKTGLMEAGARRFITLGPTGGNGYLTYDELLEESREGLPETAVEENDCFWIMATGGTTGPSKGIMKSHREWVLSLMFCAIEHGINEDDVALVAAPLCYGAGSYTAHVVLYVGGSVHILDGFAAEEVLQAIQEQKITCMFMVPTMYGQILNLPPAVKEKYDVRSIKTLISAGSPLFTKTKEAILNYFPNAGLHEYYGASDLSIVTNIRPSDQTGKTRSVGRPVMGMEACILDEDGKPVNRGEVGELYCRGHGLPLGYYAEGENIPVPTREGWYTAGDLAVTDEEGFYYIVDRKKDMIISGGINIYPREIEEVLSTHPAVLEVAVIGIDSERWGEEVSAFIVLRPGFQTTDRDLSEFCVDKIAKYKIPKNLFFIEELPKSTAGKILKRELRNQK